MEAIWFVTSMTGVVFYFVKVISVICGREISVPAPVLHKFNWGFSNTYLATPAVAYQIYFWAKYLGLITV